MASAVERDAPAFARPLGRAWRRLRRLAPWEPAELCVPGHTRAVTKRPVDTLRGPLRAAVSTSFEVITRRRLDLSRGQERLAPRALDVAAQPLEERPETTAASACGLVPLVLVGAVAGGSKLTGSQ